MLCEATSHVCRQRYGVGHGAQRESESPDVGKAWEEEGQHLPTTLGNVQRKNELSYASKELILLQDVKDAADAADMFQKIRHKH